MIINKRINVQMLLLEMQFTYCFQTFKLGFDTESLDKYFLTAVRKTLCKEVCIAFLRFLDLESIKSSVICLTNGRYHANNFSYQIILLLDGNIVICYYSLFL